MFHTNINEVLENFTQQTLVCHTSMPKSKSLDSGLLTGMVLIDLQKLNKHSLNPPPSPPPPLYKGEGGLTFSNLPVRLGMKYFFWKGWGWTKGRVCLERDDSLL